MSFSQTETLNKDYVLYCDFCNVYTMENFECIEQTLNIIKTLQFLFLMILHQKE